MNKPRVYVGLSGGVDSSLTAALLVEQGFDVTGVYMKNWSKDLPGMVCPWKEDYQDAQRVAVQLNIDFRLYDFETEYRDRVVDYMIEGYRQGITPNPDIMCNQEVKFKLFLETAIEDGADFIATGHYAQIGTLEEPHEFDFSPKAVSRRHKMALFEAKDSNKDQTYFLYRVKEEALARTLMPIGQFASKQEVREAAAVRNLATAKKKDSQGICFVGKVGIKDFLLYELGSQSPGPILNQEGIEIGQHEGAIFYTIGQRSGLGIGGGLPYYVVGKNMDRNEVYVTTDLQDEKLWTNTAYLAECHWINEPPQQNKRYMVRTRYRADLVGAVCSYDQKANTYALILDEQVRALTPGQSAVMYEGNRVLGGGIVT